MDGASQGTSQPLFSLTLPNKKPRSAQTRYVRRKEPAHYRLRGSQVRLRLAPLLSPFAQISLNSGS